MKMSENKKKQLKIVIFVTAISILIFLFLSVYYPMMNESKKIQHKIRGLKTDLRVMKQFIVTHGRDERHGHLIIQHDINNIIKQLTELGSKHQIDFISIEPRTVKRDDKLLYNRLPVQMKLVSSFQSLGEFMDAVEHLNKTKITVAQLNIQRKKELLPDVSSDILLEVYFKGE